MSYNKYTFATVITDYNSCSFLHFREKMATYLYISVRTFEGLHKNSQFKCIILIKDGSIVDFQINGSPIYFH